VWSKQRSGQARGPGYWFTGEHELLLLGTRGAIPAPAPGDNWPSVIVAPAGGHSEKPNVVYELIETYFPTLPKIELNARRARAGWDRWGFDAPVVSDSAKAPRATKDHPVALEPNPGDALLDIPTFLRRGHPDCSLGVRLFNRGGNVLARNWRCLGKGREPFWSAPLIIRLLATARRTESAPEQA
jgi:MT-A70 protein